MQVSLTEPNIKRIIQLLKDSGTTRDKLLAEYLERFLKTQCTYSEMDLDEIPF
jgi:uncharacterized protein (DUF2132 family)